VYDELLDRWGLPRPRRVARAEKGYSNETFSVACSSGEYFLRLYTDRRADPIRFEHAVLDALASEAVPFSVPQPLPTNAGDTVAFLDVGSATNAPPRPAALFPRLPGAMLDDDDHAGLRAAALAFGTLDRALSRIGPLARRPPSFDGDLSTVDPAVDDLTTLRGVVGKDAFAFIERASAAAAETYSSGLPRQLIHDDFAFTNVLLEEGRVRAILDFEYVAQNLRAKELAGALAIVMSKSNRNELWRPLLDGYLAALPLADAELDALPKLTVVHEAITLVWCVGRVRAGVLPPPEIPKHVTRALALYGWMTASADDLVAEARRLRDTPTELPGRE
jgi:homoserine kinase type II